MSSAEESLVREAFVSVMRERFVGELWRWSAENVYLDKKMTPNPGFWDPKKTPWSIRMMEAKLDPAIRECTVMKSSRTGFTEGSLNVIRWMAAAKPGPALFAISSEKKAKKVMRRLLPTLRDVAPDAFTENRDDVTKLVIALKEMEILLAGSGSADAFMEAWYEVVINDEVEEHESDHEEDTMVRGEGRLVGVDDALLINISKPQLAEGPIHARYLRGSQEKYHVPCPRCEFYQELIWDYVKFSHCRDAFGNYDMKAVDRDTYYECSRCHKPIEEKEKAAMLWEPIRTGRPRYGWEPEPESRRKGVKQEPEKVSLQISDFYSLHHEVSWGKLAVKYLNAFEINPSTIAKKFWWTNHGGNAWEIQKARIFDKDLKKLVAGAKVEVDGEIVVIGSEYRWSYGQGGRAERQVASLPIVPDLMTLGADRQDGCYKVVVCAWSRSGECYPIDYARLDDRFGVLQMLNRIYMGPDEKPYRVAFGLVDTRFQKRDTCKLCAESDGRLFPSMGHGENSSFRGKMLRNNRAEDVVISESGQGESTRTFRFYDFYSYDYETALNIDKIKNRHEPRLWMPVDYGEEFGQEICSAKHIFRKSPSGKMTLQWVPEDEVPNDYSDGLKLNYVTRDALILDLAED